MVQTILKLLAAAMLIFNTAAHASTPQKVVEIPTRAGVMQTMLVIKPAEPKAAVILFAGGHGGLQIFPNGSMKWGEGNFLIRARQHFVDAGMMVVIVDAPSDRQNPPYLGNFRQTPEHAADIKAVIAWVRTQAQVPVWLVGTSRGTQSVAYLGIELAGEEGANGLVLTSSMLKDNKGRPLPAMPLERIRIPVLVVHHESDGCAVCLFKDMPLLMEKLTNTSRKELLTFTGGANRGDPCEAHAYHGFNGLEREVVGKIAAWIGGK